MAVPPPIAALIGPTGSGKSAIAMQAAAATGAQIVAIDAFTVYRQMTVGTAKPSAADRALVRHHMVDALDVEQECSVQWFQGAARQAIDTIRRAGSPVLLVGGSGLYFRAVADPLEFPPTDAAVRARIEAVVVADPARAHARLAADDPAAAGKIDPGNVRRLTRALEVAELTGRPFSSYATAWQSHRSVYPGLSVIGLERPREQLVDRIRARVDAMLAAGWVQECRELRGRALSDSAAQAIGYAELLAWLDGGADTAALPAVAEAIAIRTRQFAARQRRWFAADPRVQWTAPPAAARLVTDALRGGQVPATTTQSEEDDKA
ncbi:tRNA (adenosine(37)-N6)-dimethylallyltransferase MiaA [soil metagenome]